MGSNVFINYSLGGMQLMYKILGKKITNYIIETSAGSIFTGGVTLADLIKCIDELDQTKVGGVAMYVAEGLKAPTDE
jgi:hypothetical protein